MTPEDKVLLRYDRVLEINSFAKEFYQKTLIDNLTNIKPALEASDLDQKVITDYSIGFSVSGNGLLSTALPFFSKDELLDSGLVITNSKGELVDLYKNRIVFPVFNAVGKVVKFCAKSVDANPEVKYALSKDSSCNLRCNTVYGLDKAHRHMTSSGLVIIVEGPTDAISMHKAGFMNTVALMGLRMNKAVSFLLSLYAKEMILLLDGDSGGVKASETLTESVKGFKICRVASLPDKKDPREFLKDHNVSDLARILSEAA